MQVFNVWGLGFGDDENAWELCSTHKTQKAADDAKQAILADCDELQVEVHPEEVRD